MSDGYYWLGIGYGDEGIVMKAPKRVSINEHGVSRLTMSDMVVEVKLTPMYLEQRQHDYVGSRLVDIEGEICRLLREARIYSKTIGSAVYRKPHRDSRIQYMVHHTCPMYVIEPEDYIHTYVTFLSAKSAASGLC